MLRFFRPGMMGRVLPALRSGLRLQRCSGSCPSGYSWQVVNRMATGVACTCTWACERGPSSGQAYEDSHHSAPLGGLPGHKLKPGMLSQNHFGGEPICACGYPDGLEGDVIPDIAAQSADYDVMAPAQAVAGVAEGKANTRAVGENLGAKDRIDEAHRADKPGPPPAQQRAAEDTGAKAAEPPPAAPAKREAPGAAPPHVDIFEGVTQETRDELNKPEEKELKQALEENPLAAEALKRCQSLCYPKFALKRQIQEIERILEHAKDAGVNVDFARLQDHLRDHSIQTVADLDQAIADMKVALEYQKDLGDVIASKLELETRPNYRDQSTTADSLRRQPGTASGGENLKAQGAGWIKEGKVGIFPKQIADQMRGMNFRNFDDFRATFWRLVAADAELSKGWGPQNLTLMRNGRAPFAIKAEKGQGQGRAAVVFNLDHKQALKNAGQVYDMDNIDVVSPKFHFEVGER